MIFGNHMKSPDILFEGIWWDLVFCLKLSCMKRTWDSVKFRYNSVEIILRRKMNDLSKILQTSAKIWKLNLRLLSHDFEKSLCAKL